MSESLKLYVTSHQTGELLGAHEAQLDIKQPDRFVIPPYHTPNIYPNEKLADNEYWALLNSDGKPERDYTNAKWVKKERQQKVTAYLKTDCTQTQEFDDKSLVTNDYTIKEPATQFDEWSNDDWVTNLSNQYIHDYNQVDNTRRYLYSEMCDPLKIEAWDLLEDGKEAEANELKQQARAAKAKIKAENPWPTSPCA